MKIFFRYLFMRLFQVFFICLGSITVIWIMVDLYGSIDDFLEHKVNILLIIRYYFWSIPKMLVLVLPAAILFSTLFTLLGLNRRSEMVALQSGGMAPMLMFSPFGLFAVIWVVILAYDMSGPSATAEVTRERLLEQVKGESAGRGGFKTLPYVDGLNHRVWFFERLNLLEGKGTAHGVEITQMDSASQDLYKYSANQAEWTGDFWRLSGGVLKSVAGDDHILQPKQTYQELDLPEITTTPTQLSLIVSQPEQLTLAQLSQYINSSTTSEDNLAKYRTEWWYRVLYPFSLLIMVAFALLYGMRTDRQGTLVGVGWSLIVFFGYLILINIFMNMGKHARLSPFVSVIAAEIIFGLIGLHLLAMSNGWWWQLRIWWKGWQGRGRTKTPEVVG